jgi:carboxylesterase
MLWLLLIPLAILILIVWLFRRIPTDTLVSKPQPAADYQEALERFQSLHEAEGTGPPLLDVCRSKLMTHGQPTEHVMVFMHGYTNCPEQFGKFGERFYEMGYNVLIPCMRYHGYEDQLTEDILKLTAEDLATYGDTAVDIARGLGDKITVMGLSAGGTVSAWLAQNRADVTYAVPLAASIWINAMPTWLTRPLIRIFLKMSNLVWWDPRTKDNNPHSPYFAYPRHSFRSLGQVLRLGVAVKEQARHAAPVVHNILMITNAADLAVNNADLARLVETWRQYDGVKVDTFQFDKRMNMMHDIITPNAPGIPTKEVYDRLVELVLKLHRVDPAG